MDTLEKQKSVAVGRVCQCVSNPAHIYIYTLGERLTALDSLQKSLNVHARCCHRK